MKNKMTETVNIVIEYEKKYHASVGALLASLKSNKHTDSVYHIYLWGEKGEKQGDFDEKNLFIQWVDRKVSCNKKLGKVIFLKWNTLVLRDLTDLYKTSLDGYDYGAIINFPQRICYLPESAEKYDDSVLLVEYNRLQEILEHRDKEASYSVKELPFIYNLGLDEIVEKEGMYDRKKFLDITGFSDIQISFFLQMAVIVRIERERNAQDYFDSLLAELWLKYYKESPLGTQVLRRSSYVETLNKVQIDSTKESIPVLLSVDDINIPYAMVLIYSLRENLDTGQQLDIRIVYCYLSDRHKAMILSAVSSKISIVLYNVQRVAADSPCYFAELLTPAIFDEYDKVLYLSTAQICNGDVGYLYRQDIGTKYALRISKRIRKNGMEQSHLDPAFGKDSRGMLLNIKKCLQEEITEKIWMLASLGCDKPVSYEDAINRICRGQVGVLENDSMIPFDKNDNPWLLERSETRELLYKYASMSEYFEQIAEEGKNYGNKRGDIMGMKRVEDLENETLSLRNKISRLEDELVQSDREKEQYLYELTETRKSITYKAGRILTWLPRKIRHQ